MHRAAGAVGTRRFPAPSSSRGREIVQHNSGVARRGIVKLYFRFWGTVIASEAKQSESFFTRRHGLLRRGACHRAGPPDPVAPRNDAALPRLLLARHFQHQLHCHQHRIVATHQPALARRRRDNRRVRRQVAASNSPSAFGATAPEVIASSVANGTMLRPSLKRAPMVEPTPP